MRERNTKTYLSLRRVFPNKEANSQHKPPIIKDATTEIINILIQLKNNGKSDYTIRNVDKFLTILSRNCNLDNPEILKI